ncbi:MAG: T9SS type A sorting domain-containing protein [Thermodesulfovibrionia bacterium]|nr:T9SS type A sorting domain-containing protein [Thermodesulfovibrionia bacterium]
MINYLRITLIIFLFFSFTAYSQPTSIEVEASFDFQMAMDFANANGVDTIFLSTPGGLYTTTDTNYFNVTTPLVIMPKPGVTEMPIFTHSDDSASVLEIFRISNDLTIQGVIFDGGHEQSHGMKYALRAGNGPDDFPVFKEGSNIIVRNCVFQNIYRDKLPEGQGHGLYFLKGVVAGTVKVENCTFKDIGDEAIRMSETEKFAVERVLDTLIVRNCTFTNIDCECIRFYADTDTSTTDAYVLLENITVDKSATRTIYIKNNQNCHVRNMIITNARLCALDRQDRNGYSVQVQQKGSYIRNVDTLNMVYGPFPNSQTMSAVKGADGVFDLFSFDPQYEDADNLNFTLAASSNAYYSGMNNAHLGDLRWATNTPTVSPLNMTIDGNGTIEYSPERVGLTFATGTNVTVTAVPDSGYAFVEWTGDITGTDNPASITVDGVKNVTAAFEIATGVDDETINPVEYKLNQNYPNPFNPSAIITFSLKERGTTSLILYDILGREIKTLFEKELNAGTHNYYFNGSNLAAGVYIYKLQSGTFSASRKMMLLK